MPCGGRKGLRVHHYKSDCNFWSLGVIGFILSYCENRILSRPALGGVASVADSIAYILRFITCHEQTQSNRV